MKIIILALSGIGDALMFTPAIRELRQIYPNARIDAVVMYSGVKDIYSRLDWLDNIYHFNFIKENSLNAIKFVSRFMGEYDVSINVYPSNRKEYSIISFLIAAKHRLAIKYLRKDFVNLGFLNNLRVEENDKLHNVEENIRLIEKLSNKKITEIGKLQFNLNQDDINFAEEYFISKKISNKNLFIGFHPGCSTLKNHANRRWSTEKFGHLASKLIQRNGASIFVFGGKEEADLKNEVVNHANSKNIFTVETESLTQTAAIMKKMNVFVTNDSSLMHVASALELNVIAVIGPTNPNYIHPWKTNYRLATLNLDCSPCFYYSPKPLTCTRRDLKYKCIKDIEVDKVYNLVISFLKN